MRGVQPRAPRVSLTAYTYVCRAPSQVCQAAWRVRLVSDLAYFDATHLAAAVRKRHGKASFAADVSKFVGAAKEARNGLRNVLGPLKRQLFDKQTL